MSLYAKINSDNIVENIIVCEDSQVHLLDGIHIRVTDETKNPFIGFPYSQELGKFKEGAAYPSWTFNESTFEWEAPVEKPSGNYHWSEQDQNWIAFIPKPGPNYMWDEETNSWVEKTRE